MELFTSSTLSQSKGSMMNSMMIIVSSRPLMGIFEQPISRDVEHPQVDHTVSCKYFISHQLSICCKTLVLHPSNVITITLAVCQVDLLHCHH